jgi:transposase-like protein
MGQGNFTEDFGLDAIKQITERGHSVADVSKCLGVSTHSLHSWMMRYAVSLAIAVTLFMLSVTVPDAAVSLT